MNIPILPQGFKTSGVSCGLKKGALDLGLIYSMHRCSVGGVFTQNKIKAAPVKLDMERILSGSGHAIVVNAGNANACTGEQGDKNAHLMARWTAECLGVSEKEVYVCSTGSIGMQLPMDCIQGGIPKAKEALCSDVDPFSRAIMTTDTVPKTCVKTIQVGGKTVTITGIAKGAGMIEPNMATMLAFILTDAMIPPDALQEALSEGVNHSFNRITVDGDMSTNDTVLMMANGQSGVAFNENCKQALMELCLDLALQIVRDGEGATKLVTIRVEGASDNQDAERIARAVGNSLLVKTGLPGTYPIWGRIMDAVGYSATHLDPDTISMYYDDTRIVEKGQSVGLTREEMAALTQEPEFEIRLDLGIGNGTYHIYTCDITEEYVRINLE